MVDFGEPTALTEHPQSTKIFKKAHMDLSTCIVSHVQACRTGTTLDFTRGYCFDQLVFGRGMVRDLTDSAQDERRRRYRTLFASTTASVEKAAKRPGSFFGDKSRIIAGSLTPDKTAQQEKDPHDKGDSTPGEEEEAKQKEREREREKEKARQKEEDELRRREQEAENAEPTSRIVAYSDSESDDEFSGPFTARRALPSGEQLDGLEKATQNLATNFQNGWPLSNLWGKKKSKKRIRRESKTQRKPPKVQQLAAIVTSQGADKVRRLRPAAVLGFATRTGLVAIMHRLRPQAATISEALVLTVSVSTSLWRRKGFGQAQRSLPRRLQPLDRVVSSFAAPSLLVQVALLLRRLRAPKRRRLRRSITESVRTLRAASQGRENAEHVAAGMEPARRPQTGAEWAVLYQIEMEEMKRVLAAQSVSLPSSRFHDNNAELMRFAIAGGILQAHSPEEKAVAIEEAVVRLMGMLTWLRKHRFMPQAQLRNHNALVRWQGWDSEGRPLLLVRIAQACDECSTSEAAEAVAGAVIAQMERAVTEMISDTSGPDKIVVVIDARGAAAMQATRHVKLFKDTAEMLNQNYPARLHQLWLVELPAQLRWVLGTVKHQIHSSTSARIRTVNAGDPACPLPPAMLDRAPMSPAASGDHPGIDDDLRRVSIPELPMRTIPSKTPNMLAGGRSPGRSPHGEPPRSALKRSPFYAASTRSSQDAGTSTASSMGSGDERLPRSSTQRSARTDLPPLRGHPLRGASAQRGDSDAAAAAESDADEDGAESEASGQSSPHTPTAAVPHPTHLDDHADGSTALDFSTPEQHEQTSAQASSEADPEPRDELQAEESGLRDSERRSNALWQLPPPSPLSEEEKSPFDAKAQSKPPLSPFTGPSQSDDK